MRFWNWFCKGFVCFLLSIALTSMPALAQSISFGVKAGTPVTDEFLVNNQTSNPASYSDDTPRYTIGPVFELHLPHHFSLNAEALYRPLRFDFFPFGFQTFRAETTANSWEFPVLVRRYITTGIRPFVDGGISFSHITSSSTTSTNGSFQTTDSAADLVSTGNHGFVAGAGLDYQKGPIHFQPEIRYTRWQHANFASADGMLSSNLNSIQILFGVTFRKE
jgi:opacity protein-like surface antigen